MKTVLMWLYQLPQNLLGLAVYGVFKLLDKVNWVDGYWYDATVLITSDRVWGLTLGEYIFIATGGEDKLVGHEMGHVRQSRVLGPLYLLVIGLPSIIWACVWTLWLSDKVNYNWFYTESIAEKLGGAGK